MRYDYRALDRALPFRGRVAEELGTTRNADIDGPRLRSLADAVRFARTDAEFELARRALSRAIRGS